RGGGQRLRQRKRVHRDVQGRHGTAAQPAARPRKLSAKRPAAPTLAAVSTIRSAGLLMFRRGPAGIEVLLAHPGGPFWVRRDEASWTLPKGEIGPNEEPLAAA